MLRQSDENLTPQSYDESLRDDRIPRLIEDCPDIIWETVIEGLPEAIEDLRCNRITADDLFDPVLPRLKSVTTFVSSRVESILGLTPKEARARDNEAKYTPDSQNRVRQALCELIEKEAAGIPTGFGKVELEEFHKDGSIVFTEVVGRVFRNPSGQAIGVAGTTRDITTQKRFEQAIRTSEEKYRLFVQHSSDGVVLCHFDEPIAIDLTEEEQIRRIHRGYRFETCNDSFAQSYGFSRADELIGKGKDAVDGLKSYPNENNRQVLLRWIRNGYRISGALCEELDRHGNRLLIEVNQFGIINDGHLTHLWASQRDVTARITAEKALAESESRLRSILDTTAEWIWEMDLSGSHTYSNQRLESILGYSPEELHEFDVFEVFHPTDRQIVEQRLPELIKSKSGWNNWVLRFRHKDGDYRYLESNAQPIFDDAGKLCGYRGSDRDVTVQKETEETLRRRELELTHISRRITMGELATGLAHELNQPLTAIANYAGLFKRIVEMDEPESARLKRIADIADNLNEAVLRSGEVIRHTRGLIGKSEPEQTTINLNDLIREVVSVLDFEFRETDIRCTLELAESLPDLSGDPVHLQQVLINLLKNAIEATQGMPPGERSITVNSRQVDNGLEVCVVDTGCGLQEASLELIFEMFFTTKETGLGIGLQMCRTIINQHNGTIRAEVNESQGMTFRVTLPLTAEVSRHGS